MILTGESLYERARDASGARWLMLDDRGKAIWRDAERIGPVKIAMEQEN